MDVIWMVLGAILLLGGIAGCILPFLPGPPIAYVGLLVQQLRTDAPFSSNFLWWFAAITLVVVVLEYLVPIVGTKTFGGSKHGVWGSTIGLIVGIFFGPVGIIAGPFAGALIGELMVQDSTKAFRAALGSFIGFLLGTLLKLIACFVMGYYLILSYF